MPHPRANPSKLYLVLRGTLDSEELTELAKICQRLEGIGALLLDFEKTKNLSFTALRKAVTSIQSFGFAALIAHDAMLAQTLKADGVHLAHTKDCLKQYTAARKLLGPDFIVGTEAGGSRHEAMCLGEEGADYIAFGGEKQIKDKRGICHKQLELMTWWAELFELPCVALDIETPLEARRMKEVGADFIAINLPQEISSKNVEKFLSPYINTVRS